MEINLIGLIIGLVLFVIAYSFILYKIMLFNGSITTLQKQIDESNKSIYTDTNLTTVKDQIKSIQNQIEQVNKKNDNLSSTIRQLSNEIILPKNIDVRPSIGAIIIYNGITLPIFCSIQNLMFSGSSKDTNIGSNTECFIKL